MRQGQAGGGGRRNRGRNGRGGGSPQGGGGQMNMGPRNDQRVRGNAHQLLEKYKNLARDAAMAGDRILSEWYLQHADHYQRVLNERNAERPRWEDQRGQRRMDDDFEDGDMAVEDVRPQGFGAAAAASTFGVDGPSGGDGDAPAGRSSRSKSDEQESRADDGDSDGDGENQEAEAEAEEAPRRRGRRRGRPRTARADAEAVDAEG